MQPWAHNGFVPTNVPCLYRRNGVRGVMHYGRVKRNRRIYLQKLCPQFEEAKKRLRRWLTEVETKAAATAAAQNTGANLNSWGDFKNRYLRSIDLDVALAPKSKAYRHECVHRIITTWNGLFEDDLESRRITSITQEQCALWANGITGYHVTTFNNTVATFKKVFEEAVAIGQLLISPAQKLKRIGKLPRVHGCVLGEPGQPMTQSEREGLEFADAGETRWYPTCEEFQAIIAKMRSYKSGPVEAAADFAELLAYTGCRLSEANRLHWSDVDWQRNRLRVDGAKGRATSASSTVRYVPISASLAGLLKRLEGGTTRQSGEPIAKVRECRGIMQRACMDLKLPRKLDHHDLRHWFSTRAVASGVPVPIVSDWLGHRDGGTLLLKTYRHQAESENQRWVKLLQL